MRTVPCFRFLALGLLVTPLARAETWTLTNHAGACTDELVRLNVSLAAPYDATRLQVTEDGRPVPYQVEVLEGAPAAVRKGELWVCTTIAPKASHVYQVTAGAAPLAAAPRVKVTREGEAYCLDNGLFAVRVPAAAAAGGLPGPILGVRGPAGAWHGASAWQTGLKVRDFRAIVVGDGTLFGKVKLRYEFEPAEQCPAPFAEVTVRVAPGQPLASIAEAHQMAEGDSWAFEATAGWEAKQGLLRRWYSAPFKGDEALREVPLTPLGSRPDSPMQILLQPRWTQSAEHGWFFGVTDGAQMAGALVAFAGQWDWPYDNRIEVRARAGGGYSSWVCPTWRGRRCFLLLAGPKSVVLTEETPDGTAKSGTRAVDRLRELVQRIAFAPLDKLTHDYILDWPGLPPGGFSGRFFYDNWTADPTSGVRHTGSAAVLKYTSGSSQPDRALLSSTQIYFDPDFYAYYYNHWSPINPNFASDMLRIPIAQTAGLKGHPEFGRFRRMAEHAFRMDLDYAVTLPGGAGQECPGYTAHAMESWLALAPLCRTQLGFDPKEWPRLKAAASFLLHTSQPLGGGQRRILPLGDTHPPGTDTIVRAREVGVTEKVEDFRTEELPGFGVVFRSHPGQNNENFLAFKAGPNRGHMHGDQLSFHYCGNGRRLAIDHMCSYSPQARQEHMHNRVAFAKDDWEYANLDGFERLIAFRASPEVDVAVGQVENDRLLRMPKLPPNPWPTRGPYQPLTPPLTYRRTVVFVKNPAGGKGLDYFVIRDQARGPEVKASYCLHVESGGLKQDGPRVDFGTLTLFCAEPKDARFERLDWSFEKKDKDGKVHYAESTVGARFSAGPARRQSQFITVLYPASPAPDMAAIPGGVRVTFGGGAADEVVFAEPGDGAARDAPVVTFRRGGEARVALAAGDLDLNRFQGEVGLFIPECGYDWGRIPDWLIQQRDARIKANAADWNK